MNPWTSATLINIALIILTGFTFYRTGSAWAFLILLFMSSVSTSRQYEDGEE